MGFLVFLGWTSPVLAAHHNWTFKDSLGKLTGQWEYDKLVSKKRYLDYHATEALFVSKRSQ